MLGRLCRHQHRRPKSFCRPIVSFANRRPVGLAKRTRLLEVLPAKRNPQASQRPLPIRGLVHEQPGRRTRGRSRQLVAVGWGWQGTCDSKQRLSEPSIAGWLRRERFCRRRLERRRARSVRGDRLCCDKASSWLIRPSGWVRRRIESVRSDRRRFCFLKAKASRAIGYWLRLRWLGRRTMAVTRVLRRFPRRPVEAAAGVRSRVCRSRRRWKRKQPLSWWCRGQFRLRILVACWRLSSVRRREMLWVLG